MNITLQHYLVLSVILFALGAIGVVARRNALIIIMSIHVMMISAALALLSFARWNLLPEGKALVLFVIAIIAAEAAVGLTISLVVYKKRKTVSVDKLKLLKG